MALNRRDSEARAAANSRNVGNKEDGEEGAAAAAAEAESVGATRTTNKSLVCNVTHDKRTPRDFILLLLIPQKLVFELLHRIPASISMERALQVNRGVLRIHHVQLTLTQRG